MIGRCRFTGLNYLSFETKFTPAGKRSAEAHREFYSVSYADAAPLEYISGPIQTYMLVLQVLKGVKTCMSVKKKNRTEVSTTYGRPRFHKRSRY